MQYEYNGGQENTDPDNFSTLVPLNSYFDVRRQNGDINISTAYNAQSMVKSCHVLYIKIIRKLQISLPHHCFLQHPLKRMSRHPRNSQNMGWKNLQKLQNPPMFNAIFDKFSQMLGNISNNPLKTSFLTVKQYKKFRRSLRLIFPQYWIPWLTCVSVRVNSSWFPVILGIFHPLLWIRKLTIQYTFHVFIQA